MGRHPNRHHPISIHAPRGGATTAGGYLRPSTANFNPPAHVGQDQSAHHAGLRRRGFNPRAPRGRDTYSPFGPMFRQIFQPTCPVGHDAGWQGEVQVCLWISTYLPRVGQDRRLGRCDGHQGISIHLPRVGQDHRRRTANKRSYNFNPPAPCGAGLNIRWNECIEIYFNPPAPCGAGRS